MIVEFHSELNDNYRKQWIDLLKRSGFGHPCQHPNFAFVDAATGYRPVFVIGRVADDVKAVALFSLRGSIFYNTAWTDAIIYSGPIAQNIDELIEFLEKIIKHKYTRRIGRIRITPYLIDDDVKLIRRRLNDIGFHSFEDDDERITGIVDISIGEDEILNNFSKSARREVRRANRQSVKIVPVKTPADSDIFFASLNRLREERNLPVISADVGKSMYEDLCRDSQSGVILCAYINEIFLGGILVYRSAHTAHGSHFTTEPGSLKRLSNLRLAPLLWWSGMIWAKNEGCRAFDVEGYREDLLPSDPMYNIYKYKGELNPKKTSRIEEQYYVTNDLFHYPSYIYLKGKQFIKMIFTFVGLR